MVIPPTNATVYTWIVNWLRICNSSAQTTPTIKIRLFSSIIATVGVVCVNYKQRSRVYLQQARAQRMETVTINVP